MASVDGSNLANQILNLSRVDPFGLFPLYLRVENTGKEVVLVGRQMPSMLINACVITTKGQNLAILALVCINDFSHFEHAMRKSPVYQSHEIPVGTDCQDGDDNSHQTFPSTSPSGEQKGDKGEEGKKREEVVELHGQSGKGEHQNAVSSEDEPLHFFADFEEEDRNHQDCPDAELHEFEPPEGRLAICRDSVIMEDVDLEI